MMAEAIAASQFGPLALVLCCRCFWMLYLGIKLMFYYGICLLHVNIYQNFCRFQIRTIFAVVLTNCV